MSRAKTVNPRRSVQLSASYYDAAGTTPLRDFGRYPSAYEDQYFTGPVRSVVLGRLRREIRNNEYLAGLVAKFPEALGASNLRSRTNSREYNAAHDLFWFRWSHHAAADGASLSTLEAIIASELLIAGEIFLVLLANGKLQPIPSEFCGSPLQTPGTPAPTTAPNEINGILYGRQSQPVAYRFGKTNAQGLVDFSETETVEARNVIHIWRRDRVLQGRGLPWLLPCLRPARDLQEITVAKTKQIKDASKISGWIERQGAANLLDQWGRPIAPAFEPAPAGGDETDPEDAPADSSSEGPVVIELKDGTFIGLEPGEKLEMLKTDYNASDYKELIMLMLHAISSPVGLPVELWFSGLGDVNYSGFKGLGTQWDSRRRYTLDQTIAPALQRIHLWRVSLERLFGTLPPNPDADDDLYDLRFRRTPVLDDEKEARKNKTRLETGERSLNDIWEEDGLYAEEILAERRELYIKLLIASGELSTDDPTDDIVVPKEFLLRGSLPGPAPSNPIPEPEPANE